MSESVPMPQACPKVSIITLTWNSYEVTRDCLLTLRKLDYPNFEVIVVDNGSTDGSQEQLAREFPEVRRICNATNLGFAGGNNVAIRNAVEREPDYLFLLNNDTIVSPSLLRELVQVGESDAKIGLLNPKIYYLEPPDKIWYAGGSYKRGWGFAKHSGFNRTDDGRYDRRCEVSFVTGCALLAKTELVRRIGLLDESFFFLFEDLDWCMRAHNAGYKAFYVPSAFIWHRTSAVTVKNVGKPIRDFYYVKNSVLFARKHLEARHWARYFFAMFGFLVYRTAGFLLRAEPKRVTAMFRGLWSGWTARISQEMRGRP
jgi:GT2 family glycosyltransferase